MEVGALHTHTFVHTGLAGTRELDFENAGWGSVEASRLALLMPACGQLRKLSLQRNEIGHEGVRAIVHAFVNGVPPASSGALARGTAVPAIDDPRTIAVAEAGKLDKGLMLLQLNLWGCQIGDAGVISLAEVLRALGRGLHPRTFTPAPSHLHLHTCTFTPAGVPHERRALSSRVP